MLETRLINGEKMNLDEAVVKNDRLIWSVVQRYVGKGKKWGLEPDDLHSICCIGLIKAFNNFDPDTYDVKFSTYAVPMMIGELQRYFRDSAGDVKFSRRTIELANKFIRDNTEDEKPEILTLHYDVPMDHVVESLEYLRVCRATSTEMTIGNGMSDGEDITIGDQLGDNKLADYSEVNVSEFLDSLEPRDRLMIELTMQDRTQKEIGDELGVSQVQVSRLMRKLYPYIEEFFGYPVGYFSDRPQTNVERERRKMTKKRTGRVVKGDLEKAKELLRTTKRTPYSIAKETGCNQNAIYYWAKEIREPKGEENPVTVTKLDPDAIQPKPEEVHEAMKEVQEDWSDVPDNYETMSEIKIHDNGIKVNADQIEFGYPDDDKYSPWAADEAMETYRLENEFTKKEEHSSSVLDNCEREYHDAIAMNGLSPADLHILFTQLGHSVSSSGVKKVNVALVVTTQTELYLKED